ncbi:Hypp3527 [Branchiostoma lanceolatum]|uniref:Hypp3527 protein n=1 Tax=Branchiostoma lanceolatum TaxID=7740 RepID=A0A8K0A2Q0_BRALA|nr:Hypp3527 [Branchiostoma lanceolatum]
MSAEKRPTSGQVLPMLQKLEQNLADKEEEDKFTKDVKSTTEEICQAGIERMTDSSLKKQQPWTRSSRNLDYFRMDGSTSAALRERLAEIYNWEHRCPKKFCMSEHPQHPSAEGGIVERSEDSRDRSKRGNRRRMKLARRQKACALARDSWTEKSRRQADEVD